MANDILKNAALSDSELEAVSGGYVNKMPGKMVDILVAEVEKTGKCPGCGALLEKKGVGNPHIPKGQIRTHVANCPYCLMIAYTMKA